MSFINIENIINKECDNKKLDEILSVVKKIPPVDLLEIGNKVDKMIIQIKSFIS